MDASKSRAICILGMHRSGTSAVTRTINLLGAYLGEQNELMPAMSYNSEGFWEHEGIVEIHEKIFSCLSRTWDNTSPMPEMWWKYPEILPLKKELTELIKRVFMSRNLWAWKDPRTCLLLPLWQEVLNELDVDISYIIVIRNPLDVSNSLKKRDGFQLEKSLGLWQVHTLSSLFWSQNSKRFIIQYDNFLERYKVILKNAATVLEIPWPQNEEKVFNDINAFIKPGLRHSNKDIGALNSSKDISEAIKVTYKLCFQAERSIGFLNSVEFSRKVRSLYSEYVSYSKMICSAAKKERIKNQAIQVFWSVDDVFIEINSIHYEIKDDDEFNQYDFNLPLGIKGPLRIDPVNFPAFVEIKSIELFIGGQNGTNTTHLRTWSIDNNFRNISHVANIIKIESVENFGFISIDDDPQLILNETFALEENKTITMRIVMRIEKQISSRVASIWKSGINEFKRQIYLKDEHLLRKRSIINENQEQIRQIKLISTEREKQLSQIEAVLTESEKQLSQTKIVLTEREKQLSQTKIVLTEREKQLSQTKLVLAEREKQLSQTKVVLAEREKQLSQTKVVLTEREKQLTEILNSCSWKITSPLRWVKSCLINTTNKNE